MSTDDDGVVNHHVRIFYRGVEVCPSDCLSWKQVHRFNQETGSSWHCIAVLRPMVALQQVTAVSVQIIRSTIVLNAYCPIVSEERIKQCR